MDVRLPLAVLAVVLLTVTSGPAAATHVNLEDVIYVLPPDRIPAIVNPTFSELDWLSALYGDQDRVLAVEINGDARAYPIRILNWHEIVDDVVGGVPIAATFCPLCGTGITYERTLEDSTVLTFRVSGLLYKNDLVMYDAESGTDSWWPQILGEAISGPFHGTRLKPIPSSTVPWAEFRDRHPDAKLLARPTDGSGNFLRNYDVNPYSDYVDSGATYFPRGHVDTETGLHPKEFVLAATVDGQTRVYPYRFLSQERVVNDVLGDTPIVVTFAADSAQAFVRGSDTFRLDGDTMVNAAGIRFDLLTGEGPDGTLASVDGVTGFWFAIFDFEMERAGQVDVYRIGIVGTSAPDGSPPSFSWLLAAIPALAIGGAAAYFLRRRKKARGTGGED